MRFQPLVITAICIATATFAAEPDDCPRDLSGLDLGRQGYPRAVDAQEDIGRPMSRRAARRARRAARGRRSISPADNSPADNSPADNSPADNSPTDNLIHAAGGDIADGEIIVGQPGPPDPTAGLPVMRLVDDASGHPGKDHDGARRIRDVPYVHGGHARQRFDLFLPDVQGSEAVPLVIWIHGNTWRDGSKDDCPITWLVDRGLAVASVGYRLTDTAVFPAQLEDCLAAVDHLQATAGNWNLDPSRFALAGSAAGGHLAALVGLAEERVADPARPRMRGVCVVSAPTLLTSLGPAQDRAGSPASLLVGGPLPEFREAAQRASPLTHVSSHAPPFLIIHAKGGDGEAAVPIEQSRQFDEALRAAGATSTLVVIDRRPAKSSLDADSNAAEPLVEFLERAFGRSGGS